MSPPSGSFNFATSSGTSPSSRLELFQPSGSSSVLEATYFERLFIRSANPSSSFLEGQAAAKPSYVTRPRSRASLAKSCSCWTCASSSFQYALCQPPCSSSPEPPGSCMTPSSVRYSTATTFLISSSFALDRGHGRNSSAVRVKGPASGCGSVRPAGDGMGDQERQRHHHGQEERDRADEHRQRHPRRPSSDPPPDRGDAGVGMRLQVGEMKPPAPRRACRSREHLAGRAPRRDDASVARADARRVELQELGPAPDDDPLLLAVDRLDVLAQQERMPAVHGLDGQSPRLAVVPEPDLLHPPDVAVGRLDAEAVSSGKLMLLGNRRHALCLPAHGHS